MTAGRVTAPLAAGDAMAPPVEKPRRAFVEVLGEVARASPTPARDGPIPPSVAVPTGGPAGPLRGLLRGAFAVERELDAALAAARRGRTFSPAELLELQTKVFRYAQAVEVLSRAADKVVGAIKQTLGTQV